MSSDWISLAALAISVIAAWNAVRGTRIANRAYKLSLDSHRRSQPSLDLYLVEAFIRPIPDPPRRVCVFKIRITNASDASNGVKAAALRVQFGRTGEPSSNIVVQQDSVVPEGVARELCLLPIPHSLAPRAVVGGEVSFSIPDDLIREQQIECYTLSIIDSYDQKVEQDAILLREVR